MVLAVVGLAAAAVVAPELAVVGLAVAQLVFERGFVGIEELELLWQPPEQSFSHDPSSCAESTGFWT